MTDHDREILAQFRLLLEERLRPRELILFGSRARGDASTESDMDVIVVLEADPTDAERRYISDCAWEAGFDAAIVLVPVVFSRAEWEEGPERFSSLGQAAAREGVPV